MSASTIAPRKRHARCGALLFLTTMLLGFTALPGDFLFDDFLFIVHEDQATHTWAPRCHLESYRSAWRSPFARRMVNLTYCFDYRHFGLQPVAYHMWNALLHAGCVLLLYLLLCKLTALLGNEGSRIPVLAAMGFACHPLTSETVCYTVGRYVLFAAFFTLASLCALVFAMLARKHIVKLAWFLASLCFWYGAMQSKEVGALFPLLLGASISLTVASLRVPGLHRRKFCVAWMAIIALALSGICAICFVIPEARLPHSLAAAKSNLFNTWDYTGVSMGIGREPDHGFFVHLLTQSRVLLRFVSLFLWPFDRLCIEHETVWSTGLFRPGTSCIAWPAFTCMLCLAILGPGWLRRPGHLLGLIGLQITLLSYLPYVLIPNPQTMVEYKFYLSTAGLSLLLAVFVQALTHRAANGRTIAAAIGMGMVFGAWSLYFVVRCRQWQDPELIFKHAVDATHTWARPCVLLGEHYQRRYAASPDSDNPADSRILDGAEHAFQLAIQRDSHYLLAYDKLGLLLYERNKHRESTQCYRALIGLFPEYATAYHRLALNMEKLGRPEEAMQYYAKTLAYNPQSLETIINLGALLATRGRVHEAIALYRQGLAIAPDHADLHNNIGNALYRTGRTDEAIRHYQQTLLRNPRHARAHVNLGAALAAKGDTAQAITHWQRAIVLDPACRASAYYNLASVLFRQGKRTQARMYCEKTLTIDPGHARAKRMMARIDGRSQHPGHTP